MGVRKKILNRNEYVKSSEAPPDIQTDKLYRIDAHRLEESSPKVLDFYLE